jgi:hypothetical protein
MLQQTNRSKRVVRCNNITRSTITTHHSTAHTIAHTATQPHSHSLLVLLDLHTPRAGQPRQVDRLEELHLPRVAPAVGDLGPLGQLDVGVLDALVVPVSVVW